MVLRWVYAGLCLSLFHKTNFEFGGGSVQLHTCDQQSLQIMLFPDDDDDGQLD